MIITHASYEKIEKVTAEHDFSFVYKGCLFFGEEGNNYCLASIPSYQYNLEVNENNILDISRVFYMHDYEDAIVKSTLEEMAEAIGLDLELEELGNLIDDTTNIFDCDSSIHSYLDESEASWIIQQYQGILAHRLGYDCAMSEDEQGTVYIAYCVDRELEEVKL